MSRRYRTEILVPRDRLLVLQLPPDLPHGRATVIVQVEESEPAGGTPSPARDRDQEVDFEWWDELGDDSSGIDPGALRDRLGALEA